MIIRHLSVPGLVATIAGGAWAQSCPGTADCCVESPDGTPGCNDEACCNAVCAIDPFCCKAEWDGLCVDLALVNCDQLCDTVPDECGDFVAGDCFGATLSPYCNDLCGGIPCADCCDTVCAVDPFCCEVQWDGFCGDAATGLCGCGATAVNDLCENATLIGLGNTSVSNECSTSGGPDHPDCSDGFLAGLGTDVWYRFDAAFTGDLTVELCSGLSAGWNPQIAVYEAVDCEAVELMNPPTACNQDAPGCAEGSMVTLAVTTGTRYFIRVGGQFDGGTGTGTLTLTSELPPECSVDGSIPPDAFEEPEVCGSDANGGCNATPVVFTTLAPGTTVHGTAWSDGGNRDTDWYEFTVATDTEVTVTLISEFGHVVGLASSAGDPGSGDCIDAVLLENANLTGSACAESSITHTVPAGTWWIFVAANSFEGVPCGVGDPGPSPVGNDYLLTFDGPVVVPCTGDTDGDGTVGVSDLTNVIVMWGGDGQGPGVDADLDDDGVVGVGDLTAIIVNWGPCG